MELRDSPLWNEVEAIIKQPNGAPILFSWKAEIQLNNKTRIEAFKVLSIEIFRDYVGAYGDEIILEAIFPAGTFYYDIYPYAKDFKIGLRKEGRARAADNAIDHPIEGQTYDAALMGDYSQLVDGLNTASASRDTMNLSDMVTVKFQLLDPALRDIRLRSVGGVFKNTTPAEVLKYSLTTISQSVKTDENNVIKGVEMVESPNKDLYNHIVIPHGTRFPDLPVFLQKKVGGIYPAGIGTYLYNQNWYVYPLYDLTRFDNSIRSLTIINIPANTLPNSELTYRTTGNQTILLATGDVKAKDNTESALLNYGNGVRYLDARRVIDGFADTEPSNNKATISRVQNNNEFVTDPRSDGMNNVMMSNARITANKFEEMSQLAKRTGSIAQVLWENSDINVVYPGMPVKFLYVKGEQISELKGVVLGAQHYVQTHGVGIADSRHRTDSTLLLFLSREA